MTFDPTKPVRTRDGRAARIICTDRLGDRPILALITACDGHEDVYAYDTAGVGLSGNDLHLVNVPEKLRTWVVFYDSRSDGVIPVAYSSEEAEKRGTALRTAQGYGWMLVAGPALLEVDAP